VGTAVTVDGLEGVGEEPPRLVAVAIAPGPLVAAAGLRGAAPHLPPVPTGPGEVEVPSRGTLGSLRAGLLLGFAGLVERLVAEAARALGGSPSTVLTGGGAALLLPHLTRPARHEPHAVLHGIRVLASKVPG